jgi:hypothetical protein
VAKQGKNGNGRYEYEHGPYYRGDGFSFTSDEWDRRQFTHCLKNSEASLLLSLNKQTWRKRRLVIRISVSFLARVTKQKPRTIERILSRLRQLTFVRLERRNFKRGHSYFVEPVFIWSSKWHELKGIERSALLNAPPLLREAWEDEDLEPEARQNGGACAESGELPGTELRQTGGVKISTAKMAGKGRQNGGACDESPGLEHRQNGADPRSDLFSRHEPFRDRSQSRGSKADLHRLPRKEKIALAKRLAEEEQRQKTVGKGGIAN